MNRALSLVQVAASLSFALAFAFGCTHASSDGATGQAPASESATAPKTPDPSSAQGPNSRGPVIATVVTHDARVSILGRAGAGEADLRVVVKNADGVLVADGITLDQLEKSNPSLHAIVTSAVASNGDGSYVDATLRRGPAAPSRGFLYHGL
jgi:hypothetical protein